MLVDEATHYSVAMPIRREEVLAHPARLNSQDVVEAFETGWRAWAGVPLTVEYDQATHDSSTNNLIRLAKTR